MDILQATNDIPEEVASKQWIYIFKVIMTQYTVYKAMTVNAILYRRIDCAPFWNNYFS